jgi:hypothetical protein
MTTTTDNPIRNGFYRTAPFADRRRTQIRM